MREFKLIRDDFSVKNISEEEILDGTVFGSADIRFENTGKQVTAARIKKSYKKRSAGVQIITVDGSEEYVLVERR